MSSFFIFLLSYSCLCSGFVVSKIQSARRKQAKSVMLHFRGREARELKKAKEEQLSLRRGASRVAREVRAFWGKLNKVGALYCVLFFVAGCFLFCLCMWRRREREDWRLRRKRRKSSAVESGGVGVGLGWAGRHEMAGKRSIAAHPFVG